MFDIERFIEAQDYCNSYETALEEVKRGCKRTHWIWYVFPQMSGLGESHMSKKYAINSLLEAKAYWDNPILKARLLEITKAIFHRLRIRDRMLVSSQFGKDFYPYWDEYIDALEKGE